MSNLQSLYAQYKGGAAPSRVVESNPYSQIADLYSVYRNPVLRDAYSGVTSGNYSLSPAAMGYLGGMGGSLLTGSPFGGLAGSALGQFAATGAPQAAQDVLVGGLASMLLKTLGVPGLLASLVVPKVVEAIPRLNPAPVEDRTPTQVEPTQTETPATDATSVEPTRADTGHLDTAPAEPLNNRSSDFDTGYASSRGGYEGSSEGWGGGGGADFDTGYAFGGGGYEGPSEGWGGGGYDWGDFGGGGGGGCVAIESVLLGGCLAENVQVGDSIILADEVTLEKDIGTVTYSEKKLQPGWKITTISGITLRCSASAPIPTPDGLVLAPDLEGKKVAVLIEGQEPKWELVSCIEDIGHIYVQHISLSDKCFWAGEKQGAYILHHNKLIMAHMQFRKGGLAKLNGAMKK